MGWRGSALAFGAVVRRAAAKPDRADRRSAYTARLPLATIDEAVQLEVARRAVAVDIISQGAAALGDRIGKRFAHGIAQPSQPDGRNAVGGSRRPYTGTE